MATLVQFLVAGVNGAQSGSATFLLRGTASSAAAFLYNDFERTAQPGTNVITLDANGAAEVYVSAYVDVVIRNSAGTILRTVTVGNGSNNVEVRSDSFTGTDYDGSPANQANQPVTLTEVLDRWNDSAGTTNFQVDIDGVATNLDSAFATFGAVSFINVKSPAYGAVGDGVTDDTTAIVTAMAAANGAIILFPPGTYLVSSSLNITDANSHWMGAGFGASIINRTGADDEIVTISDSTAGSTKIFEGIGFTATSTNQSLELNLAPNVVIKNCSFNRPVTRSSSAGKCRITLEGCRFAVSGSSEAIRNASVAGQSAISITDCTFDIAAGYTGVVVFSPDIMVRGCLFDASLVTTGVYYHINPSKSGTGIYVGTVVGNKFIDGGSDGFVFGLDALAVAGGSNFYEDSNMFVGFVAPALTGETGHIYDCDINDGGTVGSIHLGSRKGRTVFITTGSNFSLGAILEADNVYVSVSNGVTLTVPRLMPGISGRVIVTTSSAAFDIDFEDSSGFGVQLNFDGTHEDVDAGAGPTCSCGYFMTVDASGVWRSLITSEVEHWE